MTTDANKLGALSLRKLLSLIVLIGCARCGGKATPVDPQVELCERSLNHLLDCGVVISTINREDIHSFCTIHPDAGVAPLPPVQAENTQMFGACQARCDLAAPCTVLNPPQDDAGQAGPSDEAVAIYRAC